MTNDEAEIKLGFQGITDAYFKDIIFMENRSIIEMLKDLGISVHCENIKLLLNF